MEKFRTSALMAALFAGLTLLAACEKKEAPPAPAPKAEAPAPAPAQPAPAEPQQPAAAPQTPAAPAAAPTEPQPAEPKAAAPLPAECESYLAQVNECVNKLGSNATTADALKQQMEQTRASWTQIADQGALGAACKQAAESFVQHAKGMGC